MCPVPTNTRLVNFERKKNNCHRIFRGRGHNDVMRACHELIRIFHIRFVSRKFGAIVFETLWLLIGSIVCV